jgi:glutamine synthetase adenylyltransferase
MRLRPSGRSGPVATMLGSFESYQENEAWTWEHLALTRARVVSASPAFTARVERIIKDVLTRARDAAAIAGDVVEMRSAIAAEKGDKERWNLKYVAGGLIDIEFIAQYLQLVHAAAAPEILDTATAHVLDKAARLGVLAPEDADVLRPAVRLYQNLTQILRLCLRAPTFRTSRHWKPTSPKRRRACARASCGFWARRRSLILGRPKSSRQAIHRIPFRKPEASSWMQRLIRSATAIASPRSLPRSMRSSRFRRLARTWRGQLTYP